MQIAQKILVAVLIFGSSSLLSMNDLNVDVLFHADNPAIYRNKAGQFLNDRIAQMDRIEKEFNICTMRLENNDNIETSLELEGENLTNYKRSVVQSVNGLKIIVSRTAGENVQNVFSLDIRPLEALIINNASPKIIEDTKAQTTKMIQEETLKKLPFWKKYPRLTFGLGTLSGGVLIGTLAHYGYNPVSFILNATKNKN